MVHIFKGGGLLITIGAANVTVTVAVLGNAHCPAVGPKVKVMTPFKPAGLN